MNKYDVYILKTKLHVGKNQTANVFITIRNWCKIESLKIVHVVYFMSGSCPRETLSMRALRSAVDGRRMPEGGGSMRARLAWRWAWESRK